MILDTKDTRGITETSTKARRRGVTSFQKTAEAGEKPRKKTPGGGGGGGGGGGTSSPTTTSERELVPSPRLVEMRKSWSALSAMADYWDASADNYYIAKVPTDPSKPGHEMFTKDVKRFKGRRVGNGADMPDNFRADTVNAFVEGVISAFGYRVNPPQTFGGGLTSLKTAGLCCRGGLQRP